MRFGNLWQMKQLSIRFRGLSDSTGSLPRRHADGATHGWIRQHLRTHGQPSWRVVVKSAPIVHPDEQVWPSTFIKSFL
jgi:hypothetical protein